MKLVSALLLVVLAMSTSCADDAVSTEAAPTPNDAATTTATAAPTSTATTPATATPTAAPHVFRVEFPEWVEESPKMALSIATSDVIAKASLLSLESTTRKFYNNGYEAVMIYRFNIIQYLKGHGAEDIEVRIGSGPKYLMFPDVLAKRTESEALEFAEQWLYLSKRAVGSKQDAILLLRRWPQADDYYFVSYEDDFRNYPSIGETWLDAESDSTYRHMFMDGEPVAISLADLKTRIEDLTRLTEGEYGQCVSNALYWRNRVRSQILGTYREFSLAGYGEPDPFPRYQVSLDSEESRYFPGFDNSRPVFEFRRPPYESPLFSDFWLDGKDQDLFTIHTSIDDDYTYEAIAIVEDLPQGSYSVHYSQYQQSLPCDEEFPDVEGAWRSSDTAEWVVYVSGT